MKSHAFSTRQSRADAIAKIKTALTRQGVTVTLPKPGSLAPTIDELYAHLGPYFCRVTLNAKFETVVVPWNCDERSSFPKNFPDVNEHHYCKATQVAYGVPDLISGLTQRFDLLANQRTPA